MNEQVVKDFMSIYGMSLTALADYLALNKNLLNNKFSPAYRNKLTDDEKQGIKEYFQRLQRHVTELLESELEEMPSELKPVE